MIGKIKRKGQETPKARVSDFGLIQKPVITEKSSLIGSIGNRYVFRVPVEATKDDIRGALERIFGIQVIKVNTCRYSGKVKRAARTGGIGRRKNFKKAVVTIKEGQTISVVEGM